MQLLDDKMFEQKLDLFFKELNYRNGTTEIYRIEDKKSGCTFSLTYHKKENLFMYVIDGGSDKDKKKLLKKALKSLKSNILKGEFYQITSDEIYDIKSLTSDKNIFGLCKKIKLVLDGILK